MTHSEAALLAHPNPCTHVTDPCVDGTHYCEQEPCLSNEQDVMWPCPFADRTKGDGRA